MNWHNTKWRKSRWILLICGLITLAVVGGYILVAHYRHHAKGPPVTRRSYNPQIIDKPLPDARLVGMSGIPLKNDELRNGKVILVLLSTECEPCLKDGQFLKSVIAKYRNIRFYGALLIWSEATVDNIEYKFPELPLFYDEGSFLRRQLEVKSTPMKIYLDNGVVKQVWTGTPITPEAKSRFIKEFEEISSR
jgi:hypothetical protein